MEFFLFIFNTVASTVGFVASAIAISFYLYKKRQKVIAGIYLAYTAAFMAAVSLLKLYFEAPRPEGTLIETSSYGFPSGHAAGVTYLALTLCILASRSPITKRYAIYTAYALFAATVVVSRVYLYAHTPAQVFAGFALGAVWGLGWFLIYRNKL